MGFVLGPLDITSTECFNVSCKDICVGSERDRWTPSWTSLTDSPGSRRWCSSPESGTGVEGIRRDKEKVRWVDP